MQTNLCIVHSRYWIRVKYICIALQSRGICLELEFFLFAFDDDARTRKEVTAALFHVAVERRFMCAWCCAP